MVDLSCRSHCPDQRQATDASIPSGSPPDAPTAIPSHSDSGDPHVRDILAVTDEVWSLECKHTLPEKTEEDEALAWHEVIELQAFSGRMAWIEEKIKFLEQLSPTENFRSPRRFLDFPPPSNFIFGSGELKKLTKAVAQRDLSPADMDLIEITLTTIYALDKLLYLLHNGLDNFSLLGVRLIWEERRIGTWNGLRKLLDALHDFLATRARWSLSVYDNSEADDPDPGEYTPSNDAVLCSQGFPCTLVAHVTSSRSLFLATIFVC